MTPEQRSIALMRALGWQGGTIHQVAEETGCSINDLLYGDAITGKDANNGFAAVRTCSIQHNLQKVFPNYKGNLAFWLGAAEGQHLHDTIVPSYGKQYS